MVSMVEVLAHQAKVRPNTIMVADCFDDEYTYDKAWRCVKRTAYRLRTDYAVKKGDRVMVECNQDIHYLIVDFACELIGAIFVPVENAASIDRKKAIFEETNAVIWIYRSSELDFVHSVPIKDIACGEKEIESFEYPDGDAISEILFTTGTTGTSKGIMISNIANVALAENIMYGVKMKPDNVEIIPMPISHSHGLRCCYANILNGGTIVLVNGLLNIKKLFSTMEKYSATAMDLSPSAVTILITLSRGAFWEYGKKLEYIQIGTASLSEELKDQLVENLDGVHLYNFYGSTESGRSCVLDFSEEKGREYCIGKPTHNAEIVFADDDGNIINASKANTGVLASKGSMNMEGYLNNEALTSEVMRNGYVFTSDLGYMDEAGYVYILGRKGDVINCNGIKIAPSEIEGIVMRNEMIADCACVPKDDKFAGQVPKLFIQIREGIQYDKDSFSEYLRMNIDQNKLPREVAVIDKIPRTSNGKIIRRELVNM